MARRRSGPKACARVTIRGSTRCKCGGRFAKSYRCP